MFRKNSIEFPVVFYALLILFYIVCILKFYDYMSFWNILQSPDLIM